MDKTSIHSLCSDDLMLMIITIPTKANKKKYKNKPNICKLTANNGWDDDNCLHIVFYTHKNVCNYFWINLIQVLNKCARNRFEVTLDLYIGESNFLLMSSMK